MVTRKFEVKLPLFSQNSIQNGRIMIFKDPPCTGSSSARRVTIFFSLDKFPTSTSMQNFKVVALVVLEIKGVYNVHPPGPLRVAKSPVLLGLT